ncbi:MAG: MurT ligase domain-containing protein [Mycobacteriaceae bacterium]
MPTISTRGRVALAVGSVVAWASQRAGRGKGGMIGGLAAMTLAPSIMGQLAQGRRTVLVTGTNGKSTTTRMTAAGLGTVAPVASNADGANMDAGLIAALAADRTAALAVLEVDELHLPHVSDAVHPAVVVLLNLSRDQLDRVGEITMIERRLRAGLARHPDTIVVANCDDVLVSSIAFDCPNVVWVAAGGGWAADSAGCPRSNGQIVWEGAHWFSSADASFSRPEPDWWVDETTLHGPGGTALEMNLALPGRANRGNAAQAVAAAVTLGATPVDAVRAAAEVSEVAGRYKRIQLGVHSVRLLLAKNPAGWQEALSMVDRDAPGLVVAVNGQVPDGTDLSWLWDVRFEDFEGVRVVAAGERAADLAVRLTYGGLEHQVVPDTVRAIASCPPGRVEVLANYTAFRDLNRAITKRTSHV